ncbi:MAG: DUF4174 domain-containing protein [Paracoccaceae bacterium]|jgi:hypothetical protein
MKPLFALILPLVFSVLPQGNATAQESEPRPAELEILSADTLDLDQFLWTNRLVLVFADSEADPRFQEQMKRLRDDPKLLVDRDVIVLTDTDPAAKSPARQKLRPRGFMMVMMGKDGTIHLRKPSPWRAREISRSIDKLPLRLQEERERRIENPLSAQ